MDRERFDAITRLAWTSSSRRTALGLLVELTLALAAAGTWLVAVLAGVGG